MAGKAKNETYSTSSGRARKAKSTSTQKTPQGNTTNSVEKWFASLSKQQIQILIGGVIVGVFLLNAALIFGISQKRAGDTIQKPTQEQYWFLLHRKSQKEYFYRGVPGDPLASKLVKTFTVKTGIPGERPTPLPQKVGRAYWVLVNEHEQFDNPETAPYFLTLNIPVGEEEPFGPVPYTECGGQQCNWILPGAFGLHGTASDSSKLAPENPGSSGCIRHTDEDITYLYNLLDPKKQEIRYYIEDV